MCRTEYLIDWNSLEHSWLLYNHHKMSWDSNIYSPMVNSRQMSSFIHVCVVSIKFFLDSYLNKIFKGYFVVLKIFVRMPWGSHINYNYTLIVQLQWNLTSFHLEMLYVLPCKLFSKDVALIKCPWPWEPKTQITSVVVI